MTDELPLEWLRVLDAAGIVHVRCLRCSGFVYLNGYATMGELLIGLTKYFTFYNAERVHRSLANQTPDAVYASGMGGGTLIVDQFPREGEKLPVSLRCTGSFSDEIEGQ